MRTKMFSIVIVSILLALSFAACAPAPTPERVVETVVVKETVEVEKEVVKEVEKVVTQEVEKVVTKEVVVTPTPGPNPEAVIEGVEPNAELTMWTFWLAPTFDDYINSTIARFEETYPGVTVKVEDHQATFLDDYRNSFAAGNAPDVANLSDTEGWVREFAQKDLLLNLSDNLPQDVIDQYYPGLFNLQLVDGKSYQVPWYQAIAVELINKQIYVEQAGLAVEDFPTDFEDIPALCETIKESTGTLCDLRIAYTDILRDMAYQGGVEVYDPEAKQFTFDSPEGVDWLQMYVDMVAADTLDRAPLLAEDRVGLELFTSGQAAFYQTGPQLIREVRANNPGLYGYLAAVPAPVGKSGALNPTSMAMSVKADTPYPKAAMALAVFMTNPRSQLEFAKIVGIYPSTPASYDDPFFTEQPVAIEEEVRPIAGEIISKQADIVPEYPMPADVNEIVRMAVESALYNDVPAQQALSDAVAEANALIAE
jgi:ABC-type glycerol-3-phosphate transport system substrate-binding protein